MATSGPPSVTSSSGASSAIHSSSSRPSSASAASTTSTAASKHQNSKKKSEFPAKLKLTNPLPEIPFDPKLLSYPFPTDRHSKAHNTDLQRKTPYDYHIAETNDLGMPIDLLALGQYDYDLVKNMKRPMSSFNSTPIGAAIVSKGSALEQVDKDIFASISAIGGIASFTGEKIAANPKLAIGKSQRKRPLVPWLRRTEYISHVDKTYGRSGDKGLESRPAGSEKTYEPLKTLKTAQDQMRAIERNFEYYLDDNYLGTIKHPTNPDLRIEEVFPVFPDFEMWTQQFTHVVYTEDPGHKDHISSSSKPSEADQEAQLLAMTARQEALLKPMSNPEDAKDVFLSCYMPDEESSARLTLKRKQLEEFGEELEEMMDEEGAAGGELQYNYVRDYIYEVTNVGTEADRHVVRIVPGYGAFFIPYNTTMRLRKKRAKREDAYMEINKPSRIVSKPRDITSEENAKQKTKLGEILIADDIDKFV